MTLPQLLKMALRRRYSDRALRHLYPLRNYGVECASDLRHLIITLAADGGFDIVFGINLETAAAIARDLAIGGRLSRRSLICQTSRLMSNPGRHANLRDASRPSRLSVHYGIALLKWHDLGAALHARPLLGEHELATGEIVPRLREQDRNLDWECEIAVEVPKPAVPCGCGFRCSSRPNRAPRSHAFLRREQVKQHGATVVAQFASKGLPVVHCNPLLYGLGCRGREIVGARALTPSPPS
jgi:hypothetical protein